MKYFHAYHSCSDNSLSNRVKPSNYYAAKSIKDVIQKEQIKVSSYTLNKVNKSEKAALLSIYRKKTVNRKPSTVSYERNDFYFRRSSLGLRFWGPKTVKKP